MKKILFLFVLLLFVGCKNQQQIDDLQIDYDLDDFEADTEKLEDLQYTITINCKWVSEFMNDTTVWFSDTVIDLCKYLYPSLWNNTL